MVSEMTEVELIDALRHGDQAAFAQLVDRHSPALLRAARAYVPSHAIAEEVVQETWLALTVGISKFEGRSTLRTWLFAVMVNIAKTRGVKEHRDREALLAASPTVDSSRFHGPASPRAGAWKEPPAAFPDSPEGSLLHKEFRAVAERELDKLPVRQREVVTLRDLIGFESAEVCVILGINPGNQRVLLHRGRAAIRQVLEDYVRGRERPDQPPEVWSDR